MPNATENSEGRWTHPKSSSCPPSQSDIAKSQGCAPICGGGQSSHNRVFAGLAHDHPMDGDLLVKTRLVKARRLTDANIEPIFGEIVDGRMTGLVRRWIAFIHFHG